MPSVKAPTKKQITVSSDSESESTTESTSPVESESEDESESENEDTEKITTVKTTKRVKLTEEELAKKKQKERKFYEDALNKARDDDLITNFDWLIDFHYGDKVFNNLTQSIMEALLYMGKNECKDASDYNPLDVEKYNLQSETVSKPSSKRKPNVKNSKNTVSKLPRKRGQAIDDDEEDNEEVADEVVEEVVEEEKTKTTKKTAFTSVNRSGKNMLMFWIGRVIDDLYNYENIETAKFRDIAEFDKFVFEKIGKSSHTNSSALCSLVATVQRLKNTTKFIEDKEVSSQISAKITAYKNTFKCKNMIKYVCEYLESWVAIAANVIAQQLWIMRKVINYDTMECVIRMLNMGNDDYIESIIGESFTHQLENGFYQNARKYNMIITMPVVKVKDVKVKDVKVKDVKVKVKDVKVKDVKDVKVKDVKDVKDVKVKSDKSKSVKVKSDKDEEVYELGSDVEEDDDEEEEEEEEEEDDEPPTPKKSVRKI